MRIREELRDMLKPASKFLVDTVKPHYSGITSWDSKASIGDEGNNEVSFHSAFWLRQSIVFPFGRTQIPTYRHIAFGIDLVATEERLEDGYPFFNFRWASVSCNKYLTRNRKDQERVAKIVRDNKAGYTRMLTETCLVLNDRFCLNRFHIIEDIVGGLSLDSIIEEGKDLTQHPSLI